MKKCCLLCPREKLIKAPGLDSTVGEELCIKANLRSASMKQVSTVCILVAGEFFHLVRPPPHQKGMKKKKKRKKSLTSRKMRTVAAVTTSWRRHDVCYLDYCIWHFQQKEEEEDELAPFFLYCWWHYDDEETRVVFFFFFFFWCAQRNCT